MPTQDTDSQVSQALIEAIQAVMDGLGYAQCVYLVDQDTPPEQANQVAVQVRQKSGTQRHPISGVGMLNGNVEVSVWGSNHEDSLTEATVRVKEVQDVSESLRTILNGNYLDGVLKICLLMQTCGRVEAVPAPGGGPSGWIRSTDSYSYATAFQWRINGVAVV